MRRATALKVADTLALVESWLEQGRPRKRPGKPRAEGEADGMSIDTLRKPWTDWASFELTKVSLTGAFKVATVGQGYSRYVRDLAATELLWQASLHGWGGNIWDDQLQGLDLLDQEEPDNRQLIRYARAARKYMAETYGL